MMSISNFTKCICISFEHAPNW